MTVEKIPSTIEFEQTISTETERKLMPIFPKELDSLRIDSYPIEQYYVSHPSEPFGLRFREVLQGGVLSYEATLKDAGSITPDGLRRLEVPVSITPELYAYYFDEHTTPVLRKLRSEPVPGVAVDFYEDSSVQVEVEDARYWDEFCARYGAHFVDVTGDRGGDNEWRAHLSFRRLHEGHEALAPRPELRSADIVHDIIMQRIHTDRPVIVHIGGRSGSGKSTIVREVRAELACSGITTDVLSTDDYHRGTTWLVNYNGGQPWTHWDAPIVYDTHAMADDLAALQQGAAIARREIDWSIAEPRSTGAMTMPDVLLIEGIYANSPDVTDAHDLVYEMTTPLATCIGRRLLRDLRERPEFADPTKSLLYMITEAEPAYRAQFDDARAIASGA
jgi:uridine kinase